MNLGLFARSNTPHSRKLVHEPFFSLELAHIAQRANTRRNLDNVAEALAEGFSLAETGVLLDMKVSTVSAYLTRIRARLGPQAV